MNNPTLHFLAVVIAHGLLFSCQAPSDKAAHTDGQPQRAVAETDRVVTVDSAVLVSQYIRRMLEDRAGNLWFGTTGDGVVRYAGRELTYYSPANGFPSNWVSSMVEDVNGHLWFGTGGGVAHFDGTRFSTYGQQEGLPSDQVWCLLLDRAGVLWAGTEEGAARFDGRRFIPFPLPAADLSKFPYYKYPKQVNWMVQDKDGTIWFATNGAGVLRWDGAALTHLTEQDGLCNNFVETMLEDRAGDLWFGTRYGGLCRYDGSDFVAHTRAELRGDHVWTLLERTDGKLWISMAKTGLCQYDGKDFVCYDETDGEGIRVVQSLLEDHDGQMWLGTSDGVYRWDGVGFARWTKADALAGRR
ncbi:MAG: hypothetical protein JNM62_04370 [Flavobacteriales bacterium]|nr:hypothetical protein [Flavobacteriales bacterium]